MNMRYGIAVVTAYYHPTIGGAEAAAGRLVRHLVKRGHHVTVITRRTAVDQPGTETLDGVDMIRVGPIGARSPYGKWFILPGVIRALIASRRSYRAVVCVDYRAVGLAALIARLFTHAPVVLNAQTDGVMSAARIVGWVTRLGASPRGWLVRLATWPVRAAYRNADALVCISHSLEDEARTAGFPAGRIHYVPNPVDIDLFHPPEPNERHALRRARSLPVDAVVVTFVGRLSIEKGVMELIDAWILAKPDNAILLIVGPDMPGHLWDVGQAARNRANTNGLADQVRFVGGVPREEVAAYLRASDIAAHPSHFEAFGMAAAEAMATGLAVITTDVSGYRDFVVPNENGVSVPPHDPGRLSAALAHLIGNVQLRMTLGAAARQTALQFKEAVVLERFAGVIDRVTPE